MNSQEKFKSLTLRLEDGRSAVCEHFSDYATGGAGGGGGHRLTYFRTVVPSPGVPDLVERLAALSAVQAEVATSRRRVGRPRQPRPDERYKWRLTLNHYKSAAAPSDARLGFPWHRDLVANGASTMVLNLGATGALEFGAEPPTAPSGKPLDGMLYSSDHRVTAQDSVRPLERVTLTDGDLLVLTGRARWEYLHRVLPSAGGAERVSLVFGVW